MRPNPARGINRDGIRSTLSSSDFTDSTFNIVFLGDSFTFGDGVKAHESFPEQIGEILNGRDPKGEVRVANFGWVSSSPVLSYRLLRDIGARYEPDLVVFALDISDFQDDLRYLHRLRTKTGPSFSPTVLLLDRLGIDLFINEIPRVPRDRFFVANQPLELTRKYLQPTEEWIRKIAAYATSDLRADFVLVSYPRGFQYSAREHRNWTRREYDADGPHVLNQFEWLDELRTRVDFPVVSLLDDFRKPGLPLLCFDDDPHWTPLGHVFAAEAIVRRLDQLTEKGVIAAPGTNRTAVGG